MFHFMLKDIKITNKRSSFRRNSHFQQSPVYVPTSTSGLVLQKIKSKSIKKKNHTKKL